MDKNSPATSCAFRRKAVRHRSMEDLTSVFGMGTGVSPPLWSPVTTKQSVTFIYLNQLRFFPEPIFHRIFITVLRIL